MKILSFDVGIKNLAYCILTFEDKVFNIHNWGIINLTEDLVNLNNKSEIDDNFILNYKKMNIKDLKQYMIKYGLSVDYKKKELVSNCEDFLKSKKLLKLNKCKNMRLVDIGKILYQNLDKYPEFNEVDYILIENQPVLKNPTMKSIQMMLFSYFILHNFLNKENNQIKDIILISAKNKLTVYDGPDISKNYDIKSSYSLNKKLAIKYCEYMVKHDKKNLDFFLNHTKKDDLADSFLQGAYYLKKNNK